GENNGEGEGPGQKGGLAGAAAAVITPAAEMACSDSTNSETQTVQDVTVPLTLCGESLSLVCPQDLLEDSQDKMTNDVIPVIETVLSLDPDMKSHIINLLSINEVKIIVKNDGSVATCQKSGPFTMIVNYQWLQASAETTIVNAMAPVFGQMIVAKAKDFQNAQQEVRIAPGKVQRPKQT
ncbi:MAG: hypothetical protein LBK77_00825, partial [Spirochaetaceae bacterium]|nr:hypothetical protein [Spirochaetaceae bacterium]